MRQITASLREKEVQNGNRKEKKHLPAQSAGSNLCVSSREVALRRDYSGQHRTQDRIHVSVRELESQTLHPVQEDRVLLKSTDSA